MILEDFKWYRKRIGGKWCYDGGTWSTDQNQDCFLIEDYTKDHDRPPRVAVKRVKRPRKTRVRQLASRRR